MKLTLRARALGKKFTLIFTAYVLAVSSLTASVPFILSKEAGAVSDASYTATALTGWTTDRTAPSGGYSVESNFAGKQAIKLGVDGTKMATSSFYRYEGVKTSVGKKDSVQASLYVDSDWLTKDASAGLWAVGGDGSANATAYPIVSFTHADGVNGWRIWNSSGSWTTVAAAYTPNAWNTIELTINKANSTNIDVYINGAYVGQSTGGDPTAYLSEIILNSYNYGTSSYAVRWSTIQTGNYKPAAPVGLGFFRGSTNTAVNANSTVNNTDIRLRWGSVPNSERYQIRVTAPNGAQQENRYTGQTWFDLNDTTRHGYFSTQQGQWTYEVRTKDATTLVWSDWSTPISLSYDSVAPTVSGIEQVYEDKNGPRINVTLTFNEPLNPASLPQGWYAVSGSGNTKFVKAFYSTKIQAVTFTDVVGNPGSYSFTVDMTAPGGTLTYSPAVLTNQSVKATLATTEPIKVSSLPAGWAKVNDFTYEKTYEVNTTETVTLEDATGNKATLTATVDWIDKTPPTVTVKNAPDTLGSGPYRKVSFKLSDTKQVDKAAVNNHVIELTNSTQSDLNGITVGKMYGVAGKNTVQVWDVAGNVTTIEFVLDVTAPDAPLNGSPAVTTSNDFYFTWDGVSAGTGTPIVEYQFQSSTSNTTEAGSLISAWKNWTDYATPEQKQLTTPTIHSVGAGDGTYFWQVRAIDAAGNVGPWSDVWKTVIDSNAPAIAIVNPGMAYALSAPLLTGTVDADAVSVDITIYDKDGDVVEKGPADDYTPGQTTWGYHVTTDLPNGAYTVVANAKDMYGNGRDAVPVNFTIAVPVVTGPSDTEDPDEEPIVDSSDPEEEPDTSERSDNLNLVNGGLPLTTFGAQILGVADTNANDSNNDSPGEPEVEGISTANTLAAAAENTDGKAFGLAWYWWLLIIAAVASAIWWLVGAVRNRQAE